MGERTTTPLGRHQPLCLYLVSRGPTAGRLQAERLRQGHPAVHCAAAPGLRTRADQGNGMVNGQPFTTFLKGMKLTRKQTLIGTAIVIAVVGGSYGAYTYISGLPKRLTKEEAANRYLEIVCPSNALLPKLLAVGQRVRDSAEEMEAIAESKYYNQAELSAAEAKYDTLGKDNNAEYKQYTALLAKQRDTWKKASKAMLDPKFVWPEDVQGDITDAAEIGMEHASNITDHLQHKKN